MTKWHTALKLQINKLCGKSLSMPLPLYAARCSPYTPYACGAQRALRHEYS